MKMASLADVRMQLSRYVEDVMRTHERVTITENGRPAAVLISAEDLEAMEETLYWASHEPADEGGEPVGAKVVAGDLRTPRERDGA